MIRDHVFWGVGWGRFRPVLSALHAAPPPSKRFRIRTTFCLETWVCGGLLAALVLLGTLAAFYCRWVRPSGRLQPKRKRRPDDPRAEFYWGGVVGLMLAFLLRAGDWDRARSAPKACSRWHGPLSGFWHSPSSRPLPSIGRSLLLTMGVGVTALLCNLLISGGISQPSVAQPLWTMAALALPVMRRAVDPTGGWHGPGWLLCLVLALRVWLLRV